MSQTVSEALKYFQKLADEGHGDVILMCSDGQGNTEQGFVSSVVQEVTGKETGGEILDMEIGTKFVALYFG